MNHSINQPAHTIYLALGSNIGDRQRNLQHALQALRPAVTIETVSSIYETEPIGYLEQPRFLNLVCAGTTGLSPQDLLRFLKAIEQDMGRVPAFRNAPRPIDLDILLYDDLQMHTEELIIPHPRMIERGFVLIPLAEIAPELLVGGQSQSVRALSARLSPHERAGVIPYPGGPTKPGQEKAI